MDLGLLLYKSSRMITYSCLCYLCIKFNPRLKLVFVSSGEFNCYVSCAQIAMFRFLAPVNVLVYHE